MSKLYVNEIHPKTAGGAVLMPTKPAFHVVKTGTDQSITNITATKIEWTTAVTDVGGHFSISNNEYTIPVSGMYQLNLTARGTANPTNTMDSIISYLYVNDVYTKTFNQLNLQSNQLSNSHISGSLAMYLNATDRISFWLRVSGTSPTIGADSRMTFCSGYLIG
jgi:hypothetical protein